MLEKTLAASQLATSQAGLSSVKMAAQAFHIVAIVLLTSAAQPWNTFSIPNREEIAT
jgi:hypothetical protein